MPLEFCPHAPNIEVRNQSIVQFRLAGSLVAAPTELLLQNPRTLFVPFLARHPDILTVLHEIGQDSSSKEDHVLPSRGILDFDLEFLDRNVRRSPQIFESTHV